MKLRKPLLSGSALKMIAMVMMFMDHIGAVIVKRTMSMPGFDHEFWNLFYRPLKNIGGIAFPIFCFLLVEGYVHTSNVKKYLGRMLLFALISEIPFNLAITGQIFNFNYQNVFWELALGIVVMMCLEMIEKKNMNYFSQGILYLIVIAVFALGADVLKFDYRVYGIISISALYIFRQEKVSQLVAGAISFCWSQVAPIAILPIAFYNGKRGRNIKYAFYIFYPAHLLILYAFARIMGCQY